MKSGRITSVVVLLLLCCSCSATAKHTIDFDLSEPLRVAVMPFYQTDSDGKFINANPNLFFIDNIPGVSKEIEDPPAVVIQEIAQNEMTRTGFELVSPRFVQAQIVHHQLTKDTSYDYEKILAARPKDLGALLTADALLFGKLTVWDRSYYGVQTVATIGIELTLVRAADGKVLFTSVAKDADSRGISKGPTGYTSIVLEPLKGLDNEIVTDLARRVVQSALSPIYIKNRPEFLETTPPTIYASAYDSLEKSIDQTKPLVVVMYGTSGRTGSFSIGDSIENVPMAERTPGHYIGIYYPLSIDHFSEAPVVVSLTDKYGRATKQKIGLGPLTLR